MIATLAILLLSVPQFTFADEKGKSPGMQQPKQAKLNIEAQMQYLLYLPEDYETKDAWPLLLFLHGAGERGDNLDLVKVHGPPKLIDKGKHFPFIVVSPQCPKDQWWDATILTGLLDQLVEEYKVDTGRIYVTGLSMGGFGTWALAAKTPKRFAAIAPICGGGEPLWVRNIKDLPVWAFHGAKDPVVPLERSTIMIEAMKKAGASPKLTVYPDLAHDSWTITYENPELYNWLLSHERPNAEQ